MFTSSYRKSQDRERDLKLLLEMYKTAPKDTREKAQVCSLKCFFFKFNAALYVLTYKCVYIITH